jgi:hypothetical protein
LPEVTDLKETSEEEKEEAGSKRKSKISWIKSRFHNDNPVAFAVTSRTRLSV